ncbi:MAG TPA: hypothetical protein PLV06_14935 [Bacteroidales bacterium]|nr:hypothetical protein [Bacteroidales bacterium]
MKISENYGKSIVNPVLLNSIPASIIYLNNLVTDQGYHIYYHRIGSKFGNDHPIIDHYEVMSTDGQYDDIYINIHNERSSWLPPKGYLFESLPSMMCDQLKMRENLEDLDEEDIIEFDDSLVFRDHLPDYTDFESPSEFNKLLPPLERVTLDSYGSNQFYENFPFSIVREYLAKVFDLSDERANKIIAGIPRRNTGPATF